MSADRVSIKNSLKVTKLTRHPLNDKYNGLMSSLTWANTIAIPPVINLHIIRQKISLPVCVLKLLKQESANDIPLISAPDKNGSRDNFGIFSILCHENVYCDPPLEPSG